MKKMAPSENEETIILQIGLEMALFSQTIQCRFCRDMITYLRTNMRGALTIKVIVVWFGLAGFYGISTIVDYLKPNLFFIQINSSISNNSVKHKYTFFCLHTVKYLKKTILFKQSSLA